MIFNKSAFRQHFTFFVIITSLIISVLLIQGLFDLSGLGSVDVVDVSDETRLAIEKLVISEVMASNDQAHKDPSGQFSDWVEFYNGSNIDLSLKNFALTDRVDTIKWLFPDVVIPSKGYLVVYMNGERRDGLFANFRLSASKNETLILKSPNGGVVDAVEIVMIDRNHSLIRQTNGEWLATSDITPGFENTLEGKDAYLSSLIDPNPTLMISQYLPNNRGTTKFIQHRLLGFVIITNISDTSQSLEGVTLSNSLDRRYRESLPAITLAPNESKLVWVRGSALPFDDLSVGFTLDNMSGSIVLSNKEGLLQDYVEYDQLVNGFGQVRKNGQWQTTAFLSGPYAYTAAGIRSFNERYHPNPKNLMINEVMNNNTKFIPQQGAQTYDWIELKNNTNQTINLSSYALSTSTNNPQRFVLPNKSLAPNEKIVVFASGEVGLTTSSYIHLPFKLSDVQTLTLFHVNGDSIDSVFMAEVPVNMSLARDSKAGFYISTTPTPYEENSNFIEGVMSAPTFEVNPGIFNDVNKVVVTLNTNAPTYYTLDGSVPTLSSRRYVDGIVLEKTTVIKAISFQDGLLNSSMITGSYIINEKHEFPVLSMSLPSSSFQTLVNNPWVVGIEQAGHLEFYEEDGSFSAPVGIRLFGGSARGLSKKSFSIKFKTMYGQSKLYYPLFDNRDFNIFDNIVLRSGSQDYQNAFFRDVLATSLVDGLIDVSVQAYKPAVLYINGSYYGVFNIREKVDEDFISRHFNVDTNSNMIRIDNTTDHGNARTYFSLLNYVANNDLSNPTHYAYVAQRLDMKSYADFWVAQQFVTNNDIVNTRFFQHPQINDNRWRMVYYDFDWAMYNYFIDFYTFTTREEPMSALRVSTLLFRNVIKAPEFRQLFLERLSYQYKEVYETNRVLAEIDRLQALYANELVRDRARWGLSMSDWESSVERLRNYFIQRPATLKSTTKRFFNLSDNQMKEIFGD
jgi:hypothetical protein